MGEIFVTGIDSTRYLNHLVTSSVEKLDNMKMLYGMALYENGTIVDDLMIYKFNNEKYLIVVNASNIEKDFEWFKHALGDYQVSIINESEKFGQLALQGPNAYEVLNKLSDKDFNEMKMYDFL